MSVNVNVRNNNVDGALKALRTQAAPTLSAVREKKDYKKPGVRRREEKKLNIINSIRSNKKNNRRNDYKKYN